VNSSDLTYAATNSLTLNGGTINDAAGNAAVLTLPAIAVFSGAHAIVIDTTAPGDPTAELGKLKFINGAAAGVVDAAAVAYPAESCYLELYIGALTPPLASTAPTAAEISARAASAVVTSADLFAPLVISTKTSGDKIYYRFKDVAGNTSAWVADGSIPTQPSSLPAVTALIIAGDGGANAPAGSVNNAGKAAVKIRPGIMINNGETLSLTVTKGASTITATATAAANALTPVFGVTLLNVSFAGHITGGATVGAVDFTANGGITEASDVAASVKVTGTGGNESKTVSINTISYSKTAPALSTWSLSKAAGSISLTLNFSKSAKASSFDPTGVTVQNSIAPTQSRVLTAGTTAGADGTSIVITLNSADAADINSKTTLATSTADSYLSITSAAITDIYGNPITAIVPGSAIQASAFNDTTPPAAPDASKLIFNNATGKVLATGALSYSEPAKLEVYFGTSVPASSASGALEAAYASSHILNDAIITPIAAQTAGNTIYYRLVDTAGNKSSWVPDGTVPAPPTLPPASSLIKAGDGGTGAYPGTVNANGQLAVTLRPGITLNSGMSLSLRAISGNTIEMKAAANANSVTPVFGGSTLFTSYTVTPGMGNATTGSFDFSGSTLTEPSNVAVTASITDSNGNVSAYSTTISITYDAGAPANFANAANVYFDNETGKVMSNGNFFYSETGYLEIYIGPSGPLASATGVAIKTTAASGQSTGDTIISGIPRQTPGSAVCVYYRFIDLAGNKSAGVNNGWTADGFVPAAPTNSVISVSSGNTTGYISAGSLAAPVVTVTPVNDAVVNDQLFATVTASNALFVTNNGGGVANTGVDAPITMTDASTLSEGALTIKSYVINSTSLNRSAIYTGSGTKDTVRPTLVSWSMDMASDADTKSITFNFSENIATADFNKTVTDVKICKNDGTAGQDLPRDEDGAVETLSGSSIKVSTLGALFVNNLHSLVSTINNSATGNYRLIMAIGAYKDIAGNTPAAAKLHSDAPLNPTQFLQDNKPPYLVSAAIKAPVTNISANASTLVLTFNDYMNPAEVTTLGNYTPNYPAGIPGPITPAPAPESAFKYEMALASGWANTQFITIDTANKIHDIASNALMTTGGAPPYHTVITFTTVSPVSIALTSY